jgi:hypothetical protein
MLSPARGCPAVGGVWRGTPSPTHLDVTSFSTAAVWPCPKVTLQRARAPASALAICRHASEYWPAGLWHVSLPAPRCAAVCCFAGNGRAYPTLDPTVPMHFSWAGCCMELHSSLCSQQLAMEPVSPLASPPASPRCTALRRTMAFVAVMLEPLPWRWCEAWCLSPGPTPHATVL